MNDNNLVYTLSNESWIWYLKKKHKNIWNIFVPSQIVFSGLKKDGPGCLVEIQDSAICNKININTIKVNVKHN